MALLSLIVIGQAAILYQVESSTSQLRSSNVQLDQRLNDLNVTVQSLSTRPSGGLSSCVLVPSAMLPSVNASQYYVFPDYVWDNATQSFDLYPVVCPIR